MPTPYRVYFRSVRKKSGLTQTDLAFLLNLKQGSAISKLENRYHHISAQLLLSYCIIFDTTPIELVPDLVADITNDIRANTTALLNLERLAASAQATRKEATLLNILKLSSDNQRLL